MLLDFGRTKRCRVEELQDEQEVVHRMFCSMRERPFLPQESMHAACLQRPCDACEPTEMEQGHAGSLWFHIVVWYIGHQQRDAMVVNNTKHSANLVGNPAADAQP